MSEDDVGKYDRNMRPLEGGGPALAWRQPGEGPFHTEWIQLRKKPE